MSDSKEIEEYTKIIARLKKKIRPSLSAIELEQLAVQFRNNDNLFCTDVLRSICRIGGIIAVNYGRLMEAKSYPRHRKITEGIRLSIAQLLDKESETT